MKKKRVIAAVVIILVLAALSYWAYNEFYGKQRNTIEATGTIEATSVELNARVAGAIKEIHVKTGETVKAGQLVAELSRNDLAAQLERDELAVLKAEAYLDDLLSGARTQEINEAHANLEIARAENERAKVNFERLQALYEAGGISQAELENAETALVITEKRLAANEARLSMLQEGTRPEQIEAARAEVERSRAVLKSTEAVLNDLQIYSPLDGVVVSSNYERGEYVPVGASLFTIADLDNLWIKVYIPTDDLPQIRLGQEVSFMVSGIARVFKGRVEEIASKGKFTPKTIQTKKERSNVVFGVKIAIRSEEGLLKPGMPADVRFDRSGGE